MTAGDGVGKIVVLVSWGDHSGELVDAERRNIRRNRVSIHAEDAFLIGPDILIYHIIKKAA